MSFRFQRNKTYIIDNYSMHPLLLDNYFRKAHKTILTLVTNNSHQSQHPFHMMPVFGEWLWISTDWIMQRVSHYVIIGAYFIVVENSEPLFKASLWRCLQMYVRWKWWIRQRRSPVDTRVLFTPKWPASTGTKLGICREIYGRDNFRVGIHYMRAINFKMLHLNTRTSTRIKTLITLLYSVKK